MSESDSTETTTTTTARQEFAQVMAPLERACGRRLGNPARAECLAAFAQHPEGVRQVARDALADADYNALGLFAYRIRHGWHELEPAEGLEAELRPDQRSPMSVQRPTNRRFGRGVTPGEVLQMTGAVRS